DREVPPADLKRQDLVYHVLDELTPRPEAALIRGSRRPAHPEKGPGNAQGANSSREQPAVIFVSGLSDKRCTFWLWFGLGFSRGGRLVSVVWKSVGRVNGFTKAIALGLWPAMPVRQ